MMKFVGDRVENIKLSSIISLSYVMFEALSVYFQYVNKQMNEWCTKAH